MPVLVFLILAVPFAAALLVLLLAGLRRRVAGWVALGAAAIVGALGLRIWDLVGREGPAAIDAPWIRSLGIRLSFSADRLSAFFLVLVGLIGVGVVQYARAYLGARARAGWWALLLAFMGSMLGLVLSDDVIVLFVFWELTTITSSLLIGWSFDQEKARRGAIQAFLVTSGGALFMLAGLLLMSGLAGSFSLSSWARASGRLVDDSAHLLPLGLILVGALSKSAQVPFHFWLPGAMAAETPVSAYLHSATMVKAGIYLALRLFPVFSASPLWLPLLAAVGLATFVIAGWGALRSHDLKEVLAYSTSAYLGLLFAFIGYSGGTQLPGAMLLVLSHAAYKSALFLLVGWVEKVTGTRDLRTLEPERWILHFPLGAALVAVGIGAMAGLPLLLGFAAKEQFLEAIVGRQGWLMPLGSVFAVAGSALAFAYALKVLIDIFFGDEQPPTGRGHPRHEVSGWLLAVPALLLALQIVGGLAPWLLESWLAPEVEPPRAPAVWHSAGLPLLLGLAGFAAGGLLFLARRRIYRLPRARGAREAFGRLAEATLGLAGWVGRTAQGGGHPRYVALVLLFAVAAGVGGLFWQKTPARGVPLEWGPGLAIAWLPCVFTAGAAIGAVLVPRRVPKAVMLAIAGYGVALFYVVFRAPDVALTQVLVETMSLVLLLLVFRGLPPIGADRRPASRKALHAAISALSGAAVGGLAWASGIHQAARPAGEATLRASVGAGGRNVVSLILTDFRGADTLGEITVIAIAAVGAIALVRARLEPSGGEGRR